MACATKIVAGLIGGKIYNLNMRKSFAIGMGINARGGTGIILAVLSYNAEIINQELFTALVIMAIVTSMMSGFSLKSLLVNHKNRKEHSDDLVDSTQSISA